MLCNTDWLQTGNLTALSSQVLRLWASATIPSFVYIFNAGVQTQGIVYARQALTIKPTP